MSPLCVPARRGLWPPAVLRLDELADPLWGDAEDACGVLFGHAIVDDACHDLSDVLRSAPLRLLRRMGFLFRAPHLLAQLACEHELDLHVDVLGWDALHHRYEIRGHPLRLAGGASLSGAD